MAESGLPLDVSKRFGITLFHNPKNTLISRTHGFEPEIHQCLCSLVFIDILRGNRPSIGDFGSNIGLHSFGLKEKFPSLNITAFDPSPFSWKYMELTIRFNKLEGIDLRKCALGDHEGTVDLYTWGENSSGDSLEDPGRQSQRSRRTIQVKMHPLDAILDVPPLTVIKIDCEGAEVSILRGMKDSLTRNRPLIVTELSLQNQIPFGLDSETVFTEITKHNYKVYDIFFRNLDLPMFTRRHQSGEVDFLLLPAELQIPV